MFDLSELFTAIAAGDVGQVESLMDKYPKRSMDEPCWSNGGKLALIEATLAGNVDIINVLIKGGCDVNVRTSTGETALHTAVQSKDLKPVVVKLLVDHGADPNIQDNLWGHTPLHVLARHFTSHKTSSELSALLSAWSLLVAKCNVNKPTKRRSTALHRLTTTSIESLEPLKILVEAGADLDFQTEAGDTPLMQAVEANCQSVVELLVDKKADTSKTNRYQETALHIAARLNRVSIVKALVRSPSCDVNCQDLDGNTPLHLAGGKGYLEVVKRILMHSNVDPNIENDAGMTPLHVAVDSGFPKVVRCLLECEKINLLVLTKSHQTPLDLAQQEYRFRSHPEISRILINAMDKLSISSKVVEECL